MDQLHAVPTGPLAPRHRGWAWATLAGLVCVGGCGSLPKGNSTTATPPASAATSSAASVPPGAHTPSPAPLSSEARWLREWFGGTPVTISDEAGGVVRLDVPQVNAFDGASKDPKPALKAVLDRLAQSLQRQPSARLQLSLPGPLATVRGQALRNHLLAQGLAGWRVALLPALPPDRALSLRLLPGNLPVLRLDDGALPPPAAGTVRPPPAPSSSTSGR